MEKWLKRNADDARTTIEQLVEKLQEADKIMDKYEDKIAELESKIETLEKERS